jgi:hypothetical protein
MVACMATQVLKISSAKTVGAGISSAETKNQIFFNPKPVEGNI